MGIAAYNRGSKAISDGLEREHGAPGRRRADRQALRDEAARWRARALAAEQGLKRARRALAISRATITIERARCRVILDGLRRRWTLARERDGEAGVVTSPESYTITCAVLDAEQADPGADS